ncbi:type II secretion system protein [Natranaerobius thermophilus]
MITDKLKKEDGFTLIELLAVVAIIGILVALVSPNVMNAIGEAESEAEKAEKQIVKNAARTAYMLEDEDWEEKIGNYIDGDLTQLDSDDEVTIDTVEDEETIEIKSDWVADTN